MFLSVKRAKVGTKELVIIVCHAIHAPNCKAVKNALNLILIDLPISVVCVSRDTEIFYILVKHEMIHIA